MSRARFFLTDELPDASPGRLPLSADDERHLVRVLRIGSGEEIDVVTPSGSGWRVAVTRVSHDAVEGRRLGALPDVWHPDVTLFQGVAKGDKMDTIVRQAVEVGVARIVPVITSRTVVRLDAVKRAERGARWRRIAAAAAKQARRERVPDVTDPVDFDDAVTMSRECDTTIVLWEDHRGASLSHIARASYHRADARVALVIGPEGGLANEEVARLTEAGAVVASLGPSVMRTETAAIAALALVLASAYETGETGER